MNTRQRVFDFIVNYKLLHDGCAPSYGEIGEAVSISRSTASGHVNALIADGKLDKIHGKPGGLMVEGGAWRYSEEASGG